MELILSTSQSMRKRFSCRRSISSMMRLYSVGSTMFPTERAVTCQLLATADSMMAWRIAKPGGAEGKELHQLSFCSFRAHMQVNVVLRIQMAINKKSCRGILILTHMFNSETLLTSFLLQLLTINIYKQLNSFVIVTMVFEKISKTNGDRKCLEQTYTTKVYQINFRIKQVCKTDPYPFIKHKQLYSR